MRFYLYSINLIFCYIYNNSKGNFQKALKNLNNKPHFSIKNDKNHITNTNVNEIIFKKKNEPKKKKKMNKKTKITFAIKTIEETSHESLIVTMKLLQVLE